MTDRKLVFIVGLPHSGSTIFWRAFRKDPKFLCFDEPLTASLAVHFPRDNEKKTFAEYCDIFGEQPEWFWDIYRPIAPVEETDTMLHERQIYYLRSLCDFSRVTVIDETHLCTMVPEVRKVHDNVFVIHLVRRASSFVTSHLLPSVKGNIAKPRAAIGKLRNLHNRRVFFDRDGFLPGMARDQVIGAHPLSKFGTKLRAAGYDHERIMRAPAAVRLLAYWHYCYHLAERDGPIYFGDRFKTLRYEDYTEAPGTIMDSLYEWIGENPPEGFGYEDVHAARAPFRFGDDRWRKYAKIAGFSESEIDELL